ncbi:MAG: DUF4342 domain-containing protein [Bryobacteraceae bacterium]|jgi:hypothetical protein
MSNIDQVFEQIKVAGKDLVDKVGELIHEGNVRRLIIKDEHGHTLVEVPVTVATIGVIIAPILAVAGALAAAVKVCTIEVERDSPPADSTKKE